MKNFWVSTKITQKKKQLILPKQLYFSYTSQTAAPIVLGVFSVHSPNNGKNGSICKIL